MKKRNLAFTVELLGLFILLILVITVITQVFVMSRSHSLEARRLTEAVILAESTAEVISSEQDMTALSEKIGKMQSVASSELKSGGAGPADGDIWAAASFKGDAEDGNVEYIVNINRTSTDQGQGVYAEDVISIYDADDMQADSAVLTSGDFSFTDSADLPEPVYTLRTGTYFEEDK